MIKQITIELFNGRYRHRHNIMAILLGSHIASIEYKITKPAAENIFNRLNVFVNIRSLQSQEISK